MCLFELVKVEVEDGDFNHVGVVVVASEGVLPKELPLRGLKQAAVGLTTGKVGGLGVLAKNVVVGGNQEARRAASWIADAMARLRIHEGNDQVNDVARSAELAVGSGLREFAEQVSVTSSMPSMNMRAQMTQQT
jgi:hypothetical protein